MPSFWQKLQLQRLTWKGLSAEGRGIVIWYLMDLRDVVRVCGLYYGWLHEAAFVQNGGLLTRSDMLHAPRFSRRVWEDLAWEVRCAKWRRQL